MIDDDDDDRKAKPLGVSTVFFDFDCPSCNAHNPWGDGFKHKEEVYCHYCGASFEARVSAEGKLKLKEA